MQAKVDQEICIGCGICVELCPIVFEMGDDDLAKVKTSPVPADAAADCRQAAENCPVAAISIDE